MNATVIIPYRSEDPERERIFRWCLARWASLTDYPIITPHDDRTEGPFSFTTAANRGVEMAETDVVILADADTAVLHGQGEACAEAAAVHPWVIGYSRFCHLAPVATSEALTAPPDVALPQNPTGPSVRYQTWEAVCGLLAFRREDYLAIGGMDPRFQGWGWNDSSFALQADTLLGPRHRLPGAGLHLYHHLRPNRKSDPDARANFLLGQRYEAAAGDPEAMTLLVRERL